MYLKLEPKWTETLMSLPESGMGYQIVDLTLEGGRQLIGVPVFNGEDVYVPESQGFDASKIRQIWLHDTVNR